MTSAGVMKSVKIVGVLLLMAGAALRSAGGDNFGLTGSVTIRGSEREKDRDAPLFDFD